MMQHVHCQDESTPKIHSCRLVQPPLSWYSSILLATARLRNPAQPLINQGKGLTDTQWMLREANVHGLDRRSQWFQRREQNDVTQDISKQENLKNRRVLKTILGGGERVPVGDEEHAEEQYDGSGNEVADGSAHVG